MERPTSVPKNPFKSIPKSQERSSSKVTDMTNSTRETEMSRKVMQSSTQLIEVQRAEKGAIQTAIFWLQGIALGYVFIAWIYNLIWGERFQIHTRGLLVEMMASFLMIFTSKFYTTGPCCLFLIFQFVASFSSFSNFLTNTGLMTGSFLDKIFSVTSVCIIASCIHLGITLQSMEMIGEASKRDDYSDSIIVETKEKRRRAVQTIVASVMTEAYRGDSDLEVNLMVADETGKPVKLGGADVQAGMKRVSELKLANDGNVELSTVSTSDATIKMPDSKKKHTVKNTSASNTNLHKELLDSVYNNVSKQDRVFSPRKIL